MSQHDTERREQFADLYDTASRWDAHSVRCLRRAAEADRVGDEQIATFHFMAAGTWAALAAGIRDAAERLTAPPVTNRPTPA